jgi:hypothetical protein
LFVFISHHVHRRLPRFPLSCATADKENQTGKKTASHLAAL